MPKGSALIVGVGPGLGVALAQAFAADGHQVALFGRDLERLKTFSAELATPDRAARAYQVDVADAAGLQTALRAAVSDLGAPSVLVYNAAYLTSDTPTGFDAEYLAHALAVNVTGAVVAAQTVLPLLDGGQGSLLFTGGGLAVNPSPDYTSLSIGKAALRSYVYALHQQQHDSDVHVATVTINGYIGGGDPRFASEVIAAAYLDLHRQPRDEWQAELHY
jgi:short-subunit dehydrogenase